MTEILVSKDSSLRSTSCVLNGLYSQRVKPIEDKIAVVSKHQPTDSIGILDNMHITYTGLLHKKPNRHHLPSHQQLADLAVNIRPSDPFVYTIIAGVGEVVPPL